MSEPTTDRPTTVISVRGKIPAELMRDPDFEYVGRQCAGWPRSMWGNPFKPGMPGADVVRIFGRLPENDLTRGTVIRVRHFEPISVDKAVEHYMTWIRCQRRHVDALPGLRGKTLGCWCTTFDGINPPPKPCHAVVLACLADGKPVAKQAAQGSLFKS